MATLQRLHAKIQTLERQAEALRSDAVGKVRKLMHQLGVTLEQLAGDPQKAGPRSARKTRKNTGKAKYRDPSSGKTWTGHGRAPDWIKSASDRSAFLIDPASEAASSPKAKAAAPAKRKTAAKTRRAAKRA